MGTWHHCTSSTTMQKFAAFMFLLIVCSQSLRYGVRERSGYERNAMQTKMNKKNSFGSIPRRQILSCPDFNPYLKVSVDPPGSLKDVQELNITISGVHSPLASDWIAILSPYSVNDTYCPGVKRMYVETGDVASLPLLCQYPLKFQFLLADPDYLTCKKKQCHRSIGRWCLWSTCSGTIFARVVNIRTDIRIMFFGGGLDFPCMLANSELLKFANPRAPLYGHLSSVDSSSTVMRLTWISGDGKPQYVHYGDGKLALSAVATFTPNDLCGSFVNPAVNFGWHNPGFIHTALLDGLLPSKSYPYKYGSDEVGWSTATNFSTPPAVGSNELTFITYGDMGKAERDGFGEHYIQPGALQVIDAVEREVRVGNIDMILHIGDISYATGFLAEWDFFLEMIGPVASRVPYMTAIGNHERDFPNSGSYYEGLDSGGECGVPYEMYFQMPANGKDKPWYSIEHGPVHFTIMSTEHPWDIGSDQFKWIKSDLASVDRKRTPWLIFAGHRPQYSSLEGGFIFSTIIPAVDVHFRLVIEPLLLFYQVDLALWGHVHNYERTCAVNNSQCLNYPIRDHEGFDNYKSSMYSAPVHVIIGMSGFELDSFITMAKSWSLVRISKFGYVRVHATTGKILVQFKLPDGRIADQFSISRF